MACYWCDETAVWWIDWPVYELPKGRGALMSFTPLCDFHHDFITVTLTEIRTLHQVS